MSWHSTMGVHLIHLYQSCRINRILRTKLLEACFGVLGSRQCTCTTSCRCYKCPVCLIYKPYFFNQRTIFFSHNKLVNSTFSHGLSAKRIGLITFILVISSSDKVVAILFTKFTYLSYNFINYKRDM